MSAWLSPLLRWWHGRGAADAHEEGNRTVHGRAMETTIVVDCRPRTNNVREGNEPFTWAIRRSEKRTNVRYPCDCQVRCVPDGLDDTTVTGRIRNISLGGMGLVVATPVEPGTSMTVELLRPPTRAQASLVVFVVHVRPMPIRGWFLGCVFPHSLGEAEIRALV
jgi:hypothetical protein